MNRILIGLIGRRIAVTALTLLIVSAIIFTITNLLPGDAAQAALGQSATPETVAALRQQFGLDMPAHVRYLHWLTGLLHGDFGRSFSGDMPVSELIGTRLPKSLALAAITTAVSVPIALLLGILAAVKRESAVDRVISLGTLSLVATPEFLIATVAVLVFAVKLRWLLMDTHARAELAARAKRNLEGLSVDRVAHEYMAIYQRTLAERASIERRQGAPRTHRAPDGAV